MIITLLLMLTKSNLKAYKSGLKRLKLMSRKQTVRKIKIKMTPVTKIMAERMAIMETISQRLEETTTRLGDVAEGLQTNIAVDEERLKNQDKLIEEIRQTAKEHAQSD